MATLLEQLRALPPSVRCFVLRWSGGGAARSTWRTPRWKGTAWSLQRPRRRRAVQRWASSSLPAGQSPSSSPRSANKSPSGSFAPLGTARKVGRAHQSQRALHALSTAIGKARPGKGFRVTCSDYRTGGVLDADNLRAQLRARSAGPNRFARGGVMPVEAKHSAIPEAQVRRRSRITISFLTTIPPGFPTTRAARSALARAINAPFPPSASPPDLTLPQKPSLHPRRVCSTPRTTATRAASASSASSTKPPRARTWSKRSRCSCA